MEKKVSIIIPLYNRESLISETLDSVISQTYQNWECIVVDDGSTDDSKKIVKQYCLEDCRFKLFDRPKNKPKGGNAARNFGFEKSIGDYIQWFDSDDIMLEDYLSDRLKCFTKKVEFVISTGYSTNALLKDWKKIKITDSKQLYKDYTLSNSKVLTPSVLFNRTFLKGKQMFLESLFRGQETELFSRLFYAITLDQYYIINKPLFLYRQHLDTKSKDNKIKYIAVFKQSLALISIDNFKRGLQLRDKDILNHHYQLITKYFFEALYQKDKQTMKMIYKKIFFVVLKTNFLLGVYWNIYSTLFLMIGRSIYRVEKKIKNYQFN